MQEFIQAGVLGLVQGLTEFIPVSSSGHLILTREVLGWNDPGVAFDAVLHLATLLAVLIYFRADWMKLLKTFRHYRAPKTPILDKKLLMYIGFTTIPGAVIGATMKDSIETVTRHLVPVAILMIAAGIMFIIIERISKPTKPLSRMNSYNAWSIGIAQALAIIPGISRSGATIATGIYNGFKRADIAKYSFLASAPIILLAGGYGLAQTLLAGGSYNWPVLGVAFVVAFLSGLMAIRFMMIFLSNHNLVPFAWYRFALGGGLLIYHFFLK